MNFLAHIYLSGDNDEVMVGNFIGDWVKGRAYEQYPGQIRKGILLHREIDRYTDQHEITKAWAAILAPNYHHYAGVVVDIFYDYFLAIHWDEYSDLSIEKFIVRSYKRLMQHAEILPPEALVVLQTLIDHKRLQSYAHLAGIKDVLNTMALYTSLPNHTGFAIEKLMQNIKGFSYQFHAFMKDIIQHIHAHYGIIPLRAGAERSIAS